MISLFPKANNAGGLAPREIFTGIRTDKRYCKLGFEKYFLMNAENNITNTIDPRTFVALSMRRTGNMQETYLFMIRLT